MRSMLTCKQKTGSRAQLIALTALMVALSACGGGGSSPAPAPIPAPPAPVPVPPPFTDSAVRVSGNTPFAANCDGVAATGTLYANAEVEPFVAINPRNTANLIGVWQQDRWSDGGSRGTMTGVSFDGGATWSRIAVPFSRCGGGNAANGMDYARASDPWITFAPDGTAHQMALSLTGGGLAAGSSNAMVASRSQDGGRSWSAPIALIRDGADGFNDKNSMTADPTDARYVYAVWDRLASAGGGPSYLARTTDGGATWEAARPIYDPGPRNQTLGNQIVVLPDGVVVNLMTAIRVDANNATVTTLEIIRSTDKGASWSAPVKIADVFAIGARDPEALTRIRDGSTLGTIAVSPAGAIYVAWQDARFAGGANDGIVLSRSSDGGANWSLPVRVNSVGTVAAFTPALHVRADGVIGLTYYDLRDNTPDATTLPTSKWLATSRDGVTWSETRVTAPFDLAKAPNARGLFLGDYQGLVSSDQRFTAFYSRVSDGLDGNRTDIFVQSLGGATSSTLIARKASALQGFAPTPELLRKVHENTVAVLQRRPVQAAHMQIPAPR